MRQIVVMRHARASPVGPSDFERRLEQRGREDAAEAGSWLAGRGFAPGLALVSAAVRTQETWAALSGAAGWGLEATVDEGLYAASSATVVDLLRSVSADVASVLVLGHNPTMAALAQVLDDGEGDPAATTDLLLGYPTCALTLMDVPGPWAEVERGAASVRAFHVGRAPGP